NVRPSSTPRMNSPPELLHAAPVSAVQEEGPRAPEHLVHHPRRQFSGVGVLSAGVITRYELMSLRESILGGVGEGGARACRGILLTEQLQIGVERDFAQRHDDTHARKRGDLGGQMRQALADFS